MPTRAATLRIGIVSPAAATARTGNAHTAGRYARFLRGAGYRVRVLEAWSGEPLDVLIALHARKSAHSILSFAKAHPQRPLIVVLTGTDLYHDLARSRLAQRALEAATALVTLQSDAIKHLPRGVRGKAHAIVQSAQVHPRSASRRSANAAFTVCVLGHLRYVKDPLRAAYALREIPEIATLRVIQAGAALEPRYATQARALEANDTRYRWIGEVSHARTLRILRSSDLCVISSRMEGGANVLSEAIAAGVPVIASRISGNRGLLGTKYAGFYPLGDTRACARLLKRIANDGAFRARLQRWIHALRPLVAPRAERQAWCDLVAAEIACAKASTSSSRVAQCVIQRTSGNNSSKT